MEKINNLLIDQAFYRSQQEFYIGKLGHLDDPLHGYEGALMKAICMYVSANPDCFIAIEDYALAKEENGPDLITSEFVKFVVVTGVNTSFSSRWDGLTSEIIHWVDWRAT